MNKETNKRQEHKLQIQRTLLLQNTIHWMHTTELPSCRKALEKSKRDIFKKFKYTSSRIKSFLNFKILNSVAAE